MKHYAPGYPQEITYELSQRIQTPCRLVRFECPVKRCKVSVWATVEDRTRTVENSRHSDPRTRFYCPGDHKRRVPRMVEAEALSLIGSEWVASDPRPPSDREYDY